MVWSLVRVATFEAASKRPALPAFAQQLVLARISFAIRNTVARGKCKGGLHLAAARLQIEL